MQQQQQQQQQMPTVYPPSYSMLPPAAPLPMQQQPQPLPHQPMMPMVAAQTTATTSMTTFQRISTRHTMFKVAFGGLFLSALLFIIGFSAPAWTNEEGLWLNCHYHCRSNVGTGPGWLDAVRSMETLALVCFLICMAVALYQEVFKCPPPPENKAVEILAACAAIFGLIGLTIFGAKIPRRKGFYQHYYDSSYWMYLSIYIQWGYALAAAGSILALLCAILVAYSRVVHVVQASRAMPSGGVFIPTLQPSAPSMTPLQTMSAGSMHSHHYPAPGYLPAMPPCPYLYPCPYPYPVTTALTGPSPHLPPSGGTTSVDTSAGVGTLGQAVPTSPSHAGQAVPTSPSHAGQAVPTSACHAGQALPTSPGHAATTQGPAFFLISQGQVVPVYNEAPSMLETSSSMP